MQKTLQNRPHRTVYNPIHYRPISYSNLASDGTLVSANQTNGKDMSYFANIISVVSLQACATLEYSHQLVQKFIFILTLKTCFFYFIQPIFKNKHSH